MTVFSLSYLLFFSDVILRRVGPRGRGHCWSCSIPREGVSNTRFPLFSESKKGQDCTNVGGYVCSLPHSLAQRPISLLFFGPFPFYFWIVQQSAMVARRGVKRNVPCSCKGGNGGKEGSFRVGHRGGISRNFSYLALFLVPPSLFPPLRYTVRHSTSLRHLLCQSLAPSLNCGESSKMSLARSFFYAKEKGLNLENQVFVSS